MHDRMTDRARKVMRGAKDLAVTLGYDAIDTPHVLQVIWSANTSVAANILKKLGVRTTAFKKAIAPYLTQQNEGKKSIRESKIPLTPHTKRALQYSLEIAKEMSHNVVGTEHLLLGLLLEKKSAACEVLASLGVTPEAVKEHIEKLLSDPKIPATQGEYKDSPETTVKLKGRRRGRNETPHIDKFCVDLTELARNGKLDPCIGRTSERKRVIQILGRKTKNNPVLIGEPGCGKTKIAEGIAIDISNGNVPESLKDKRVCAVDLPGMVAGTKYRGQFEERIKGLMREVVDAGNVVLFLDELHTLVGAGGSEGGMDAANILKPALARGKMQCIGATTLDEYRKHIEKDGALDRRFQPIIIDPPTREQTLEILRGLQSSYEAHHNCKFTDEALKQCVLLSEKYVSDRYLPDKAIDVMDEAGSSIRMDASFKPEDLQEKEKRLEEIEREKQAACAAQEFEAAARLRDEYEKLSEEVEELSEEWKSKNADATVVVDEALIAEIVSNMTGIPLTDVSEEESERLLHFEQELHKRVVSQNDAIKRIAESVRRARAGLKDPKKPTGSFLFVGPTGVGKTLLCKALAKFLFGSEDSLIQIDMSEYMEKHNASRLVGAPPGYVGYEEGGQLTEKVRRKPYSVVLLDEIEKAHPDIFNMLLQIMEEGKITDSFGRAVNFKNTILVMTSNVGSDLAKAATTLGFGTGSSEERDSEGTNKILMEEIEKTFRPEFLNRLDETIVFEKLTKKDLREVIDIELQGVLTRLLTRGLELQLSEEAKEFLIEEGYSEVFGARPLKRAIEKHIENPLSEALLRGDFKKVDVVVANVSEDRLIFEAGELVENGTAELADGN